jgi:Flp pilus assembly protein TadG
VVLGITLSILLALIVGGLGVMRYQQVAHLARESARAASVLGNQYPHDFDGERAALYSNGTLLAPSGLTINVSEVGLDPNALTWSANWPDGSNLPYRVISDSGQAAGNRVQVTLRYRWVPELRLPILGSVLGGVIFSSTAEMQITN